MYNNTFSGKIRLHLSNSIGKTINKKIIVFESDDWGSIRTANSEAFQKMQAFGLDVDKTHYGFDSLESNQDIETLFNVLLEFRDSTGRPPVFTSLCIMGNPDLEKIAAASNSDYYFQPLHETLKGYPTHNKIQQYWKEGEENRLFVPAMHGREHINVRRFIQLLRSGDEGFKVMLKNNSIGVPSYKGKLYTNYLGALHPGSFDELNELHEQLLDAGKLFERYVGHSPAFFVAPNAEEPKELERTLKEIGIRYIGRAKRRVYPLGDGTFMKEWNWPGKQNEHGQIILVRNAFFEPVCFGEHQDILDWVDNCLHEIDIAFKWKKPAVISTHRVNYIGYIEPKNRDKGIRELRRLLNKIIQKWPEVEFMTSIELGDYLCCN